MRTSSSWESRFEGASIRPRSPRGGEVSANSLEKRCPSSRPSSPCSAPPLLSAGCAGATSLFPLLVVLALDGGFAHLVSKRVGAVLAAVDQRTHDLVLLSELLRRLERERFETPLLQKLVKSLETDGLAASAQIQRLARLLNLLDYQRNQLFMPLAFLWHWQIQISLLIDAWRAGIGPEDRPVAGGDRRV